MILHALVKFKDIVKFLVSKKVVLTFNVCLYVNFIKSRMGERKVLGRGCILHTHCRYVNKIYLVVFLPEKDLSISVTMDVTIKFLQRLTLFNKWEAITPIKYSKENSKIIIKKHL